MRPREGHNDSVSSHLGNGLDLTQDLSLLFHILIPLRDIFHGDIFTSFSPFLWYILEKVF